MSKIYLPTSEQMDVTLANLARIAGALGTKEDVSTWAGIQKAVKSGVAPQIFPVGTQFTVSHSVYGDMLYDVVAHDYFKSAHDANAHTMTLMCHDILGKVQYDSSEAFYYADATLPAGTYNFTILSPYNVWGEGTYQFTLVHTVPKGGQLCISGSATTGLADLTVRAYANQTTTTAMEESAIIYGYEGTNLGTFGVELNYVQRVSFGSNNYKESAIRQFLNSSSAVGSVWSPQTKFDRPPIWVTSLGGFMNGLDEDFLSVVGKVSVPCSTNDTYESPDSTVTKGTKYNVIDRFYLASQKEVLGVSNETVNDDSVLFPYYKDAADADRIKYRNGSPASWWTRSPYAWQTFGVRVVASNGGQGGYSAYENYDCVPVCTIV